LSFIGPLFYLLIGLINVIIEKETMSCKIKQVSSKHGYGE